MGSGQASLVSVIIPSFNGATLLGEAIDSALAQTHPAVEVVVVDDGSTDDTAAVLSRYRDRVRTIRQDNRGLAAARNTGVRAAVGEYVAFLDHDDRFRPEKLAAQAGVLDAQPQVGLVYTGWRFIDGQGRPYPAGAWPRHEGDVLPELVLRNFVFPASIMARRALVVEAGGFDESRTGAEDWDLWLRLSLDGARWACVDAPLLEYRVHPGQMSTKGPERRASNRMAILAKAFADPRLPDAARARQDLAYHREHLRRVVDYSRAGRPTEAVDALLSAVSVRPAFLTDRQAMNDLAHLLAPWRLSKSDLRRERWAAMHGPLRRLLSGLFSRRDLDPSIARLKWPARRTYARLWLRSTRRLLRQGGEA